MVCSKVVKEIPATAVEVKVTNVTSPSSMKMYNTEGYSEKLDDICKKIKLLMRKYKVKEFDSKVKPCVGDMVIIHRTVENHLMLPAWLCRGILGNYDEYSWMYNVFLVDHGCTIRVFRSDFLVVPKSRMNYEYLTCSIGMNNLIPAFPGDDSPDHEEQAGLSKEWSDIAIKITRDCIAASTKICFDYQAVDENGTKYGELYLIMEDEVQSLSEILISKKLAIYETEDMTRLIESPHFDVTRAVDSLDGDVVVRIEAKSVECPRKHRVNVETNDTCYEKEETKIRTTNSAGNKSIPYLGKDCQQILVRSNIKCDRLIMMADARFPTHIHKALRRQSVIALRRIQSYMCPAVSKGLNVLAVGPPKCGKTLGYLMPIVSIVATSKKIPRCNNPTVLILCSSTIEVLNVKRLCSELLEVYTDIRCVAGFNGRPNRSLVADIYNGCQILIATPPFLVRFINRDDDHKKLINFENLSHLVIDGIDVILNKYYDSFQQLFARNIAKARIEKRDNLNKPSLQIIAVSGTWSSLLNEFAKQCMIDPYVCIGSYMEAAIYGRMKPKLYVVHSEMKMQRVKEILGDNTTMIKTAIICRNTIEARALNEYLSSSYKTLVACEQMVSTESHGIAECWKATVSGSYPILICTDEVLVDLNITDVDWLIHYSVATQSSKTQFYFRFSTLMKNLEKANGRTKVTIIADETNDRQLHSLVKILERCGVKLSPQFIDNVMRISMTLDSQKKGYSICGKVKAFGYCPDKNSCSYRHCVLASVDTPITPIKIGDSVKLVVTYVHNATHFTARVMEYISPHQEVTKYSSEEYTRLSTMVQTYYADGNNRRCQKKVHVGGIYGHEIKIDNFRRVKVLHIANKDSDVVSKLAELKCVDTGDILKSVPVTRLLELPEDLASLDTHIVEVYLAGIVPYDNEYEWNSQAIDDSHNWFRNKSQPHSYVVGKVRLHVADTIWVDPLEIRTKIIGHRDLVSASLKRHMIQLKHGVSNENHLSQLYELCNIGSVKYANGDSVVPSNSTVGGEASSESESLTI